MTTIYAQGSAEFTVPANEKVAVFSNDGVVISYQVGYPNYPSQWKVLTTTAAGDAQYVSAAFTSATRVRVDAGAAPAYYETGSAPSINEPQSDISAADATFTITGLAAAQGGYVAVAGGTSSTAGNAGGAASLTGGQPGATGVGGAASVVGGIGGATSGTGGAAALTGGAGTNGNAAGGAAVVTGGAGQGTGAGGAASVVGGASGAGATGNGAAANVTGGAALSTNGNGGSVILTGGAKTGTGVAGMIIERAVKMVKQGAPTAKTTSATLTAAEVLAGIITVNQGAAGASALQLPLATDLDTAMPDAAAGDAFDFSVINISTVAAEDATITTNTGWTLVGNIDIASNAAATDKSAGRFRARKTGAGAWTLYRLS